MSRLQQKCIRNVDPKLWHSAKVVAAMKGVELSQFVQDALREAINRFYGHEKQRRKA